MRVFDMAMGIKDFSPMYKQEDRSMMYDIILKLDNCFEVESRLQNILEKGKDFCVYKEDWLFCFMTCCGCSLDGLESVVLDKEDIAVLLVYMKEYSGNLILNYVSHNQD